MQITQETIQEYCTWISTQIAELTKSMDSGRKPETTTMEINLDDVKSTIKLLSSSSKYKEIKCCLSGLETKIENTNNPIDYFFIQAHCIGHGVLETEDLNLDLSKEHDAGSSEWITLMFAALCCRHFYNLDKFSEEMFKEWYAVTLDIVSLGPSPAGLLYTYRGRIKLAQIIFSKFISSLLRQAH